MESKKSKDKKKHKKELKSFKNKMGPSLAWFNSLTSPRQYDLLFRWKQSKWHEKSGQRSKIIMKWNLSTGKREKMINPPLKFKHWIVIQKHSRRFRINKSKMRDSIIDIILTKK
jgi:hypothetical protein